VSRPTFSELATAAYCPRKLYYRRREGDGEPPPDVEDVRALAFEYPALADAPADALADRPIEVAPAEYRRRLADLRERPEWPALADPEERDVLLEGRDCAGRVQKVLDGSVPVLVSGGDPPESGVWEPQSVRAVAAGLALSYRGASVERALVEYPAYAVVREVPLTARRRARFRRVRRAVEAIDGPPARVDSAEKCEACEYREQCGVRTRSLRSLLFG
jgi:CRISPR-associated exonuclease Cas4